MREGFGLYRCLRRGGSDRSIGPRTDVMHE
jgi:hypothetical protein